MKYIRLSMLFLLTLSSPAQSNTLTPFTSDGCSLFPDGSINDDTAWLHCCTAHDFDYWQGGTSEQRLASDKQLAQCVDEVDIPGLGILMYLGVRLGGIPMMPTSFRWGYGWSINPGYRQLTADEQKQVEQLTINQN